MHAGHWDKSTHKSTELGGKTLGLLCLGAIGRRMAKMAHAMEMRVMGFDPFASGLPDYIEQVPLQTIWKEADAISQHCTLPDENSSLITAKDIPACTAGLNHIPPATR